MADGNFDNVTASGRVVANQDVLAGASVRAGTFVRVAQDLEVTGPATVGSLTSLGWVAVGHTGPTQALDVRGNVLIIPSGVAAGNLYLLGGRIGIGTSSPSQALEVTGSAQVTDLRATEGVSVAHTNRPSQALDVQGNVVISPSGVAAGNVYLLGGRMGIGTSSPSQALEVTGVAQVTELRATEGVSVAHTNRPSQALDVRGNVLISPGSGAAGNVYLLGGRMGIGTSSPSQALEVTGSAQVTDLRATEGMSVAHTNRPSQALDVRGNVLISPSGVAAGNVYLLGGRLGIGTSSPSQALDVQGTALVNGNVGIRTSQPGQALDVAGHANVRQFLRIGAEGAPSDALDVTGNAVIRGAVSLGASAGSPRRTLDVTGDALFTSTIRADGHVGIGEEPAPSGGERLRVTGNVRLAGLVSATQFKTSGGHLEIANDGHIEATRLTLRPYGVSPGAAVLTVDTLGNIVATSFRGAGVDSSNTVRAEFGFYAGPGGTPRKVADANGCYYA